MTTRLFLTPADAGRRLTLEEFLSASSREGSRYELIHGRLDVAPAPSFSHEWVRDWFRDLLQEYAKSHPDLVDTVKTPARVCLPEPEDQPTAPEPDLARYHGVAFEKVVEEIQWEDISPILVIEFVSPDNADKDLDRNVELYLQVPSIREYWILDPRQGSYNLSLLAYRRRGQRWAKPRRVKHGASYTTPLLAGFELLLDPYA